MQGRVSGATRLAVQRRRPLPVPAEGRQNKEKHPTLQVPQPRHAGRALPGRSALRREGLRAVLGQALTGAGAVLERGAAGEEVPRILQSWAALFADFKDRFEERFGFGPAEEFELRQMRQLDNSTVVPCQISAQSDVAPTGRGDSVKPGTSDGHGEFRRLIGASDNQLRR